MYFGKNIDFLIDKKNLSQKELAEMFDLGQSTISGWINGRSFPNFHVLLKLGQMFNINLDSLIYKDLSNELKISNELIIREVNEGSPEYNIVKIFEPVKPQNSIDTEGVGILESLIKRIERLEQEVKELKMNT